MHREPTLHSKALTNPLMHECETFILATIAQFNTPFGGGEGDANQDGL